MRLATLLGSAWLRSTLSRHCFEDHHTAVVTSVLLWGMYGVEHSVPKEAGSLWDLVL